MVGDASVVLREARKRAGLSQAELARRAGVVQPVISAYENGRREPGLAMLTKLVRATGLDLVVEVVERPQARGEVPDSAVGRRLRRQRDEIVTLAARRGAHNVRVFGSVARGEDTEDSDVDLLVDLADDVGLVDLIGLERELSQLLDRKVDVVPARALKPGVATSALTEAIPL